MLSKEKINEILTQFAFEGKIDSVQYPFGEGHINDTIAVTCHAAEGTKQRYIVQKINKLVFKKPDEVMANIASVTAFLREKIAAAGGDPERETLSIVPTKAGGLYYIDADEEYWRAYPFIEDSITYQNVESVEDFAKVAKAYGQFMLLLQDYPAVDLYETIVDFHHTQNRFKRFLEVLEQDALGRAKDCQAQIRFIKDREADCAVLVEQQAAGLLPTRVTHNDTKLNNILFDAASGEGICVIDLDTIMPGLAAYDFGDAIRSGATTAAEDEADLSKVQFVPEYFSAYAKAYLATAGKIHDQRERESLAWGARLLTLEQGMRFLTDYLEGDVYFKIHRPGQNLDRTVNQLKLLADMEEQWEAMLEAVR